MASSSLALRRFPDMLKVPDPVRGRFMVQVRIAYTGQLEDGERLLRPLRSMGPVMDSVSDMPYTASATSTTTPPGRRPSAIAASCCANSMARRSSGSSRWQAPASNSAGPGRDPPARGALSRMPETPNAISHRDAAFGMNLGMLVPPGHEKRVDGIQQALIDGLRPWSTGGTLPNYLGSGYARPHQVRAAYSDADYEAGCHQDGPRPAQPVSSQPQHPTAAEPWKSSFVSQWRQAAVTKIARPITYSGLLTVRSGAA